MTLTPGTRFRLTLDPTTRGQMNSAGWAGSETGEIVEVYAGR